ncbi:MAG TPA: pyridoxamine 5'-phosphate oxidase family protein [Candidatus Cloacimonadota bacterium]|nr:pyridoxamine 5'-phosphate oxidase family protein [Candidatus Cloacimonadota bacterium]
MKEVLKRYLKPKTMADIATLDGVQPRVRPMTLMWYKESFWLATGRSDAKTAQLESNPLVEAVAHLNAENSSGYIRISGRVQEITDFATKKDIADFSEFIYNYWEDPANPDYVLYRIIPHSIRLMEPGDMLETEML